MSHDQHYQQFVVLFFLGLGLLLASGANLATRRAGIARRGTCNLLAFGTALLACWLYEGDEPLLAPLALALTATVVPLFLLTTSRGNHLLDAVCRMARSPLVAWSCCGIVGVVVIVVAARRFEDGMANLDLFTDIEGDPVEYRPIEISLRTDCGTPVEAHLPVESRSHADQARIEEAVFRDQWSRDHVVRTGPCDDRVNCYGWVFTGGKYWIPPKAIYPILTENDYREVQEPMIGDLVVYRNGKTILHVAIVRYTAPDRAPMVEGKLGEIGVFLHPVDRSMYSKTYSYLRSPRAGHLLAGLSSEPPAPAIEDRNE